MDYYDFLKGRQGEKSAEIKQIDTEKCQLAKVVANSDKTCLRFIVFFSQLRVIRDDATLVCSEGPNEADQHDLCGITLFGRTKNGEYPSQHYTYENGTSVYEIPGVYIQLESTSEEIDRISAFYYSLSVMDNTAGHAIWSNFHMHNARVSLRSL